MGIGVWELLLLLLIVLLLFGTKRLRNIGGDLGSAIKSFRTAINANDPPVTDKPESPTGTEEPHVEEHKDPGR